MIQSESIKDLRRKLARGTVELAKQGATAVAPSVMHEDVAFFLDPELYVREHQKFFRQTPLVACLSSELAEPSAYRTFDDAGVPILVTRAKDGKVRAFLNVCRHRGSRIVRSDCGKASRFTCRFHGWTYDTKGDAVAIPEESQFCGRIDEEKRLVSVPAEERHGLVFVQLTPDSRMDLDAHLGDFARELETLQLQHAVPVLRDEVNIASNWKYTLDTYFETYHLRSLHGITFANLFAPLCAFETFGPHHRYTFSPATIYDWANMPESEWPVDSLPLQYFIFPHTVLSVGSVTPSGSTVTVHRMFPKSVNTLTTKITLCAMHGVTSPEHLAEIESSFVKIMHATREEDYSVTGESCLSLSSLPPGTKFPIGRQEIGVQNFHRNVYEYLGHEELGRKY
jgi:phenylpropionate dioxygenase-like ring-hydroxylating dioxygenase large terminal subunit